MEGRWCKIEHMDEPYMTVIGSHLYGTSHEKSDLDLCIVLPIHHGEDQKRIGNIDLTLIGLAQFTNKIKAGIPRALDALFATPISALPEELRELIPQIDFSQAITTHKRTATAYLVEDSPKNRVHAQRVLDNLQALIYTGTYNPHLPKERVMHYRRVLTWTPEEWGQYIIPRILDVEQRMRRLVGDVE